jgi:putative OPT family oligopeptide transporter
MLPLESHAPNADCAAVSARTPLMHEPAAHRPLVGPERSLPEITIKAVVLGVILAMIMAAANAYLGLRVGMTVAAAIPASAIALGVLRAFRSSNILENNQVQTIASAGASTVSGVIFTVPALVIMGTWQRYEYWPIVLMVCVGGIMGVVFTTPLRRALIVDTGLTFPEGVATAQVLKTGGIARGDDAIPSDAQVSTGNSGLGFRLLLEAGVIGSVYWALTMGAKVFAEGVATTKAFFSGSWLFRGDVTLQPSLLGIGFIVGPNIGTLMLSGAVIGTTIGVPVNWWLNHEAVMAGAGVAANTPLEAFTADQWEAVSRESWQNCRRIGIGCMLVGGVWSLITLLKPIKNGLTASLAAYRAQRAGGAAGAARTEFDTPLPYLAITAAVMTVPLFLAFHGALGDYPNAAPIAVLMTLLMLVFGFLFASVAGYMAGLVGSSNNPVSGVTMATVVVTSLLLTLVMGTDGIAARVGPPVVIYLAAFICTGACIAGDNLQDLKCGHVVGSTPWKQQVSLVIGTIASAAVIPLVLSLLDDQFGIGRTPEGVDPSKMLDAPQATLMGTLASGIFGTGDPKWGFIGIGCVLAVFLIALDNWLKRIKAPFRTPILAVAVGIYLPFGLSVLIFVGGILAWVVKKIFAPKDEHQQVSLENAGMLLASGLIAGEAITGVAIAGLFAADPTLANRHPGEDGGPMALVATLALIVYLFARTLGAAKRM